MYTVCMYVFLIRPFGLDSITAVIVPISVVILRPRSIGHDLKTMKTLKKWSYLGLYLLAFGHTVSILEQWRSELV